MLPAVMCVVRMCVMADPRGFCFVWGSAVSVKIRMQERVHRFCQMVCM